jgi:hypothetical protein
VRSETSEAHVSNEEVKKELEKWKTLEAQAKKDAENRERVRFGEVVSSLCC